MEEEKPANVFEEEHLFLGTGLTESILSASLATHLKKSVNIEASNCYSGTFCTLTMKEIERIIKEPKVYPQKDKVQLDLSFGFYQEGVQNIDQLIEKYGFRGFNIDFNPRLIFSTGQATEMMIEAQIDNYISFRSLKGLYFADKLQGGKLEVVPTDKGAIFNSKIFSLFEKKELFNFLNTAMRFYGRQVNKEVEQNSINDFKKNVYSEINDSIDQVSKKDDIMKQNFVQFIQSAGVTSEKMIRLIACCMCNYRVNPLLAKKSRFEDHSTEEMLRRLTRFIDSMHVHGDLPYLYPIYGTGDITQICSRISAVYGSTFLLGTDFKVLSASHSEEEGHLLKMNLGGQESVVKTKRIYIGPEYRSLAEDLFVKGLTELKEEEQRPTDEADDEFVSYVAYLCKYDKNVNDDEHQFEEDDKPIFPLLCYLDIPLGTDSELQSQHPITCLVTDHTCGTSTEGCILIYFNYYRDASTKVNEAYLLERFVQLMKGKFARIKEISPIMSIRHTQRYRSPGFTSLPNNVVICPDTDFALDMEDMFINAKKQVVVTNEEKLFKREVEDHGEELHREEEETQAEISALTDLANFNIN